MPQEKAIILDQSQKAAKAISGAVASLSKVTETLAIYAAQVEDLTEKVNVKTNELVELDIKLATKINEINTSIAEKERSASVDLKIKLKENEDKILADLAKARGSVIVAADVIPTLESKLSDVEKSVETAVTKAVASTTKELKAVHEMEIKTIQLTNAAETAKINADLDAKDAKIKMLEEQLKLANAALDAERTARVTIAASSAQPVINVGTAK